MAGQFIAYSFIAQMQFIETLQPQQVKIGDPVFLKKALPILPVVTLSRERYV